MRLGVNIEFEGKNYDILELPAEAFQQLIPGLTDEQFRIIDGRFRDFWPEPTQRRNHMIAFAADLLGTSIDFLLLNRDTLQFDDTDLYAYIEEHTKQGNRPS
jgi:hypothetical protein